MKSLIFRRATPADKPALFDFLRQAYPERWQYKFPERWEWEFERNPFVREALPVWIALDGDRVVGQSCALVEPLVIYGQEYRVGWGVDFFVLPGYRGQGVGTRLQEANNAGNEIFMSLSMAQMAARIKANIGLQALPPVPVFTKIVRHEPESVLRTLTERTQLPERVLRWTGIHSFGASLLTTRGVYRDRDRFILPSNVDLTPAHQFGPETDDLWERLSGKFSALVRRNSQYLNWKFIHQPHVQRQSVLARQNGELRGYVIFRRAQPPERNVGLILDIFADPTHETILRALLGYAIQHLQNEEITYLQSATSVQEIQKMLVGWGFKQTKTVTPMIRANVAFPHTGWLLGKGDHDWDQFPLA